VLLLVCSDYGAHTVDRAKAHWILPTFLLLWITLSDTDGGMFWKFCQRTQI